MDPLVLPLIMGGASMASGLISQERQAKHNKGLAQFQHDRNMELLKYQLDYNSPKSQMARFAEAGLNPNLIYGQASSGNMQQQSYPNIQPTDMSLNFPAIAQMAQQVQQLELIKSQADLNKVKADESVVKQDLMTAQKQLVEANPYLNESYVGALIDKMQAQVNLTKNQSVLAQTQNELQSINIKGAQIKNLSMLTQMDKMKKEIELLSQKFMLNKQQYTLNDARILREQFGINIDVEKLANMQTDREIKAKIIESKTFENKILEIQSRFMMGDTISGQAALDVTKFLIASIIQLVK